MGYDLHITRGADWSDNGGREITLAEWNRYVQNDLEIEADTSVHGHYYIWSGESELESPWLAWEGGNILTRYPDRALLGKMLEIADALGAKVLGDDGEEYRSISDHPSSDEFAFEKYASENESWPLNLFQIPVYFFRELWEVIKRPTFRYVVVPFWLISGLIIWRLVI